MQFQWIDKLESPKLIMRQQSMFDFWGLSLVAIFFLLLFLNPNKRQKSNMQEENNNADDAEIKTQGNIIPDSESQEGEIHPQVIEGNDSEISEPEKVNPIPESSAYETRKVSNLFLKIRSFKTPKLGLSEKECEDSYALSNPKSETVRIAVTDGATESLFSNVWADLLAQTYIDKGSDFLNDLQSISDHLVNQATERIKQMPDTRHWFMYEKLERGSHATFAGIEFYNDDKIKILTIGDSCVFWRYKHDGRFEMLPELSPEDFGVFPASICNLPQTWKTLPQKEISKELTSTNVSQIIICTDSLACWLAKKLISEPSAWEELFTISDCTNFTNFFTNLREKKEMRNDDITLVLIDVLPLDV